MLTPALRPAASHTVASGTWSLSSLSAPNCPPEAPEFAHRPDDAQVRDVQIALSDLQLGVPEQQLDLTDVEAVLKPARRAHDLSSDMRPPPRQVKVVAEI